MESLNFFKGYGKVNPSEEHQSSHNPQNPQKNSQKTHKINFKFLISLALIFITLIGVLVVVITGVSKRTSSSLNSSESLRTVCEVTQHPDSCFSSISSLNDPPGSDPVRLYNLSLQVTFDELKNLSSLPETLISKSNDKRTESALKDCADLFADAVSQLGRSLDEMKEKVGVPLTEMKISDMQTWVSAAMTDQDTCLEGLEEMGSGSLDEVKARVQRSKVYMSNSLAILNNIHSLVRKFGGTIMP